MQRIGGWKSRFPILPPEHHPLLTAWFRKLRLSKVAIKNRAVRGSRKIYYHVTIFVRCAQTVNGGLMHELYPFGILVAMLLHKNPLDDPPLARDTFMFNHTRSILCRLFLQSVVMKRDNFLQRGASPRNTKATFFLFLLCHG